MNTRITTYLVISIFIVSGCIQKASEDKVNSIKNNPSSLKINEHFPNEWTLEKLQQEIPYDSDTFLSNGYYLSFSFFPVDDYFEKCLILKSKGKSIDTLNVMGALALNKNLGYIGADFDNTFVFVNSFGSGNPHYISLLNKKNAENLIPNGSAWIDADTIKQVLLYSKVDVPSKNDSMTLFDTKKMTKKEYSFPQEIFGEPEILNRIKLLNITESNFTIEYEFHEWKIKKQKTYYR